MDVIFIKYFFFFYCLFICQPKNLKLMPRHLFYLFNIFFVTTKLVGFSYDTWLFFKWPFFSCTLVIGVVGNELFEFGIHAH
jgi:hypothetical protein